MARSAADLVLALKILRGPDGIDPACHSQSSLDPAADFDWRGRKVFVIPKPRIRLCTAVQTEMANATVQAAKALQNQGAVLEELPDDLFWQGLELWSLVWNSTGGSGHMGRSSHNRVLAEAGHPEHLLIESLKLLGGHSQHTPPTLLFAWLERLQGVNPQRLRQALHESLRLRSLLERRLKQQNLLLLPPQPTVAPLHDELLGRPFDFGYTAVLNLLHFPAAAIPLGLNSQGLPFGVQAIAGLSQDHLCLQAARTLEQAFGGWSAPLGL